MSQVALWASLSGRRASLAASRTQAPPGMARRTGPSAAAASSRSSAVAASAGAVADAWVPAGPVVTATAPRVADAHHGRFGDRRVLVQHLLDLPRIDVVAAPDDQVLLAVHDEEIAVLVLAGQVAGAKPPVGNRLPSGLLVPPVALHDVVPADRDLADRTRRHVVAKGVDHPHLDAVDRGADRAGFALPLGVVEGGDRRGLREAVALQDDAAHPLLEATEDLHRQRGASGHAHAQRARILFASARLVTAVTGAWSRSIRSSSAGATPTNAVPAASAPLAASVATACQAKISLAAESPR